MPKQWSFNDIIDWRPAVFFCGVSLQSYSAIYRPGMYTTAFPEAGTRQDPVFQWQSLHFSGFNVLAGPCEAVGNYGQLLHFFYAEGFTLVYRIGWI